MTSVSRTGSLNAPIEPAALEDRDVDASHALSRRLRAVDGLRLLLARMNWEKLFNSADARGALPESVAQATLTRKAIRAKEARRRALRSGLSGLTRAIQAG